MKTILLIVLWSSAAAAQDTSATMASLNGEKAECRYLMTLCDEVVALSKSGSPSVALRKLQSLTAAAGVLKAKHDKPPKCLAECDERLDGATRK